MKIRTFLQKYFIISRQNRFFRIFGKTGPRIWNFFSLKPSRDQDGANKKRLSQIGPAIPELLRHTQTDIHTYRQKPLLLCSIDCNASYLSTTYFDKHA